MFQNTCIPIENTPNIISQLGSVKVAHEETARKAIPFTTTNPNVIYNDGGVVNINSNNNDSSGVLAVIIAGIALFFGLKR